MVLFVRIFSQCYGYNCAYDNPKNKKVTCEKSEDLMNVAFNVCLVVYIYIYLYESGIE